MFKSNPETLKLAMQTIAQKQVKEIYLTLACGCEIVFGPLVADVNEAIIHRPCQNPSHSI